MSHISFILLLALIGCSLSTWREYYIKDGVLLSGMNFSTKEDCEDFISNARKLLPEIKRFCSPGY